MHVCISMEVKLEIQDRRIRVYKRRSRDMGNNNKKTVNKRLTYNFFREKSYIIIKHLTKSNEHLNSELKSNLELSDRHHQLNFISDIMSINLNTL